MTRFEEVPGLTAPARRALIAAGYDDLEALAGVDCGELALLHGMGPRALERIEERLREGGRGLGGAVPAPDQRTGSLTRGHTGETAADVKTTTTDVDPVGWIESLPWPRRQEHGRILLEVFGRVTGEAPVMWGPTMIGYGDVHYVSPSGREGDWFLVGFSPRKANISLYGLQGSARADALLAQLGRHRTGAGCVWINKPEDVDLDVLETLIREAWDAVE